MLSPFPEHLSRVLRGAALLLAFRFPTNPALGKEHVGHCRSIPSGPGQAWPDWQKERIDTHGCNDGRVFGCLGTLCSWSFLLHLAYSRERHLTVAGSDLRSRSSTVPGPSSPDSFHLQCGRVGMPGLSRGCSSRWWSASQGLGKLHTSHLLATAVLPTREGLCSQLWLLRRPIRRPQGHVNLTDLGEGQSYFHQ